MAAGVPPEDEPEVVEPDVEHEWRMARLTESGFTRFQAFLLSSAGADWHRAVRMLNAGCDPDHVVEILT